MKFLNRLPQKKIFALLLMYKNIENIQMLAHLASIVVLQHNISQKEIILDKKLHVIKVSGKILQILKSYYKTQEKVEKERN
jgi:hypothetical protein